MRRSGLQPLLCALSMAVLAIAALAALAAPIEPNADPGTNVTNIQGAIDAIKPTAEVIQGAASFGGVVELARGTFNVNASIKLYSGIWLKGQGPGTVVVGNLSSQVLELDVPNAGAGHLYYDKGRISDMRVINTNTASNSSAIKAVAAKQIQGIFEELWVESGGVAIDLDPGADYYAQDTVLRGIRINGTSSAGLGNSILRIDGNMNLIEGFDIQGSVRSTWVNGRPLMEVAGENHVRNNIFEATFANGQNGYAFLSNTSEIGSETLIRWDFNHVELHVTGSGTITNTQGLVFNNTRLLIDVPFLLNASSRLGLGTNTLAKITYVNCVDADAGLMALVVMDPTARLTIDELMSRWDAGCLDDDRVKLNFSTRKNGIFNGTTWDPYSLPARPPLVYGNNFIRSAGGWIVTDTNGPTYTVNKSGTKVTINVTAAANGTGLWVQIPIDAPVGTEPDIARMKITAPGGYASQPVVYTQHFDKQLSIRAINRLTWARIPHTGTTSLYVNIPNLNTITGNYTVEQVMVNVEER